MSVSTHDSRGDPQPAPQTAAGAPGSEAYPNALSIGPIGRLGRFTATHFRLVLLSWLVIAAGLGVFAPRAETQLAGAGWETAGAPSVTARGVIDSHFGGFSAYALEVALHSDTRTAADPGFRAVIKQVERTLRASPAVNHVLAPEPGASISRDGHTAIVQAGAAQGPNHMVEAANPLKQSIRQLSTSTVSANLTGDAGMWSDFNQANRTAMMRSEMISWPITLGILLVAFGSLVAAGLPLMLTMVGLLSAAGLLTLGTTHVAPISIWAMNFALMFALALGIDYALFIVHRFRSALFGHHRSAVDATAIAMDTAGKAVAFSGLTVLVSLSAVLLVPSPAFRSMSLGIMLAVIFVLAATLTLLPAVLGKIGAKVDKVALPWTHQGEHRSKKFERWGVRLWTKPVRHGLPAFLILACLAIPILTLRTSMPSVKVVPQADSSYIGYQQIARAFGPGADGPLQIVTPDRNAAAAAAVARRDRGVGHLERTQRNAGWALITAIPNSGPSTAGYEHTVSRLQRTLPHGSLIGGAGAESYQLQQTLKTKMWLVIGVVTGLGFLLLLIALQAPLLAAVGVLLSLLSTGAAFGIAKWIFQDGDLHSLLGFTPQGFLDAWAPVFFFAMVFAISMDYTMFLLSAAKEHWDHTHDPRQAMIGGVAHSGRVIFAAAGVMVAVFFTFALSGPLPPKEMGAILGIAVLLDAGLIRLLLLPILLRVLGSSAWYLPRWAGRILPNITFGHA